MRLIEVVASSGYMDTLRGIAEQTETQILWLGPVDPVGRQCLRLLAQPAAQQKLIDAVQQTLTTDAGYRLLILPVEASLPRDEEDDDEAVQQSRMATREELYNRIADGARLDGTYLWLVGLSTVVAAIGLQTDNVAVVIGAMVIAPLLGPNLALAFATTLGDFDLLRQSLRTCAVGLGLALGLSLGLGMLSAEDLLASDEIRSRTDVGLDGVALALASGTAAVLSLTTGLSMTLVGVMVAVALLPPTVVFGMLWGAGQWSPAFGAFLLLTVNVVCVILAAKLVFVARGVKPRRWLEKRRARQSSHLAIVLWLALLGILVAIIFVRRSLLV